MTTSDLLSQLSTKPQTAKQIAMKLGLTDHDSAVRIGSKLSRLFFTGYIERESIKINKTFKKAYFILRKVDSNRYSDIQC